MIFMNKKHFFLLLLIFVFACTSYTDCNAELIGIWEDDNKIFSLELFNDGTGTMTIMAHDEYIITWVWMVEVNLLRIVFSGLGGDHEMVEDYKLSGTSLISNSQGDSNIILIKRL